MQINDGVGHRPAMLPLLTWALLLFLAICITIHLGSLLTKRPNTSDASQNVRTAFSLVKAGTFASSPTSSPSMYREPLPVFALAAQIAIDPRLSNVTERAQLGEGSAIIALKQHNLAWAFLLLLGIPFFVEGFLGNRVVWFVCSVSAMLLTTVFFLERPAVVDRNYTEIQTATLLIWSAVAAQQAVKAQRLRHFLILGALLGALVLTKAAFAYVVWVYLGLLFLLLLVGAPSFTARRAAEGVALALAGAVAVLGPWSVRNYIHFGTFNVAERGGVILWMRAVKNGMNNEEWRGAFYVYAPDPVSSLLGEWLGYSKDDLEIDGPLRRLNRSGGSSFAEADRIAEREGRPEDATSFYRAARAERNRLQREYGNQAYPNASTRADAELQRRAVAHILADSVSHLHATPVFFWRGMWAARSDRFPSTIDAYASVFGMIAIWMMALGGLIARRPAVFGTVGLAVGIIAFYALASHSIPRYTWPLVPVMMVAISVIGGWIAIAVMAWVSQRRSRAYV